MISGGARRGLLVATPLDVAAADPGTLHADQDFVAGENRRLDVEDVRSTSSSGTHHRLPATVDEHLRVHVRRQ